MAKRHLPFVVAAGIAALLIGAPARSQAPSSASIVASDDEFNTPGGGAPTVTIAPSGTVAFSYPSGGSRHNVVFTSTKPSSCQVTAGSASGGPEALPSSPARPGWAGTCTFAAAATYRFVCGLHSAMTGSVTVAGPVAIPPQPPAPPASPPPPPPPPPRPPSGGAAAFALRLATVQRGVAIRGSVHVTRPGSRLLARAFARRGALRGGPSALQEQVGRQSRPSVGGRRVAFTVRLNPVARRALRRNGRLAISLRLTITPATGRAYAATRTVILRPL